MAICGRGVCVAMTNWGGAKKWTNNEKERNTKMEATDTTASPPSPVVVKVAVKPHTAMEKVCKRRTICISLLLLSVSHRSPSPSALSRVANSSALSTMAKLTFFLTCLHRHMYHIPSLRNMCSVSFRPHSACSQLTYGSSPAKLFMHIVALISHSR